MASSKTKKKQEKIRVILFVGECDEQITNKKKSNMNIRIKRSL